MMSSELLKKLEDERKRKKEEEERKKKEASQNMQDVSMNFEPCENYLVIGQKGYSMIYSTNHIECKNY